MFLKKIYFIIVSFIFIGCGADSSTYNLNRDIENNKTDCSQKEQNRVIYDKMKDSYLWYRYVPDIDYNSYSSIENLLNDLKYREYDKWSYITSTDKYNNFYEKGVYEGYGFSIENYHNRIFISYVYKNSPADRAGLKRGTEILEINNKSISYIYDKQLWETVLKKNNETQLKILNNNIEKIVKIKKSSIKISSIFFDKIIYLDNKKIGYFVLNRFIEPTRFELKALFDKFKKEEIDELILDMRYNGGGRLSIANYLASLIGGENTEEMIFQTLEYNDKHENLNNNLIFSKEKNSLNLDRVFVISTKKTCSASESLINGLKPYMSVNLIGSKTCGKPMGTRGVDFCDKHFSPIEFKTANVDGYSDYFEGIEPRCHVEDDIMHPLGDTNESMLKESIFFIKYGICSTVSKRFKEDINEETSPILRGFQKEIDAI